MAYFMRSGFCNILGPAHEVGATTEQGSKDEAGSIIPVIKCAGIRYTAGSAIPFPGRGKDHPHTPVERSREEFGRIGGYIYGERPEVFSHPVEDDSYLLVAEA